MAEHLAELLVFSKVDLKAVQMVELWAVSWAVRKAGKSAARMGDCLVATKAARWVEHSVGRKGFLKAAAMAAVLVAHWAAHWAALMVAKTAGLSEQNSAVSKAGRSVVC